MTPAQAGLAASGPTLSQARLPRSVSPMSAKLSATRGFAGCLPSRRSRGASSSGDAARAAILALLRGLAGRSHGVDTVIADRARSEDVSVEAARDSCLSWIPRRGLGEAEEVANLAIFPCADLVWNIAGKAISAD